MLGIDLNKNLSLAVALQEGYLVCRLGVLEPFPPWGSKPNYVCVPERSGEVEESKVWDMH